jgi:hypothetical protein
MAAKREERRIVIYLDGLPLAGDLRSERVNELPVPAFVAGATAADRVICGVGWAAAAPYGDGIRVGLGV